MFLHAVASTWKPYNIFKNFSSDFLEKNNYIFQIEKRIYAHHSTTKERSWYKTNIESKADSKEKRQNIKNINYEKKSS